MGRNESGVLEEMAAWASFEASDGVICRFWAEGPDHTYLGNESTAEQ